MFYVQDMRVQAYRCSNDPSIPSHQPSPGPPDSTTLLANGNAVTVSLDKGQHTSNSNPTSNGRLSRTAALIDSPLHKAGLKPCAANGHSSAAVHSNSGQKQPRHVDDVSTAGLANGAACNGHSTPHGGVLVASSDMADSHCGVVIALALCGEYVCSAAGDAMIKLWKVGSLEFVRYWNMSSNSCWLVCCIRWCCTLCFCVLCGNKCE